MCARLPSDILQLQLQQVCLVIIMLSSGKRHRCQKPPWPQSINGWCKPPCHLIIIMSGCKASDWNRGHGTHTNSNEMMDACIDRVAMF